MSNIKRGDFVKVIALEESDVHQGFKLGQVYEVGAVDKDGDVNLIGEFTNLEGTRKGVFDHNYFKNIVDGSGVFYSPVLYAHQVELVSK